MVNSMNLNGKFESDPFVSRFFNLRPYQMLAGMVDLHIHSHPDCAPRLLDDLEIVAQAKAVGMRAVMLKSHVGSSVERAYIAQQAAGEGIEVYGMVCLNPSVGGLNPEAVRMALKLGAKGVWMPSMWAEHHAAYIRNSTNKMGYETFDVQFPQSGITILHTDKGLKPEVVEILELMAERDAMLSTGHLSLDESQLLVDEAISRGVTKILIHTVNYHVLNYPTEALEEFTAKGAMLEFGWTSLLNPVWAAADPSRMLSLAEITELIRRVGVEKVVVTSDAGPVTVPPAIECMRQWYEMLKIKGFDATEIDIIMKENPARLLGLSL